MTRSIGFLVAADLRTGSTSSSVSPALARVFFLQKFLNYIYEAPLEGEGGTRPPEGQSDAGVAGADRDIRTVLVLDTEGGTSQQAAPWAAATRSSNAARRANIRYRRVLDFAELTRLLDEEERAVTTRNKKLDLVVLDSIAFFVRAGELGEGNSNAQLFSLLAKLRKCGTICIVVNHLTRGGVVPFADNVLYPGYSFADDRGFAPRDSSPLGVKDGGEPAEDRPRAIKEAGSSIGGPPGKGQRGDGEADAPVGLGGDESSATRPGLEIPHARLAAKWRRVITAKPVVSGRNKDDEKGRSMDDRSLDVLRANENCEGGASAKDGKTETAQLFMKPALGQFFSHLVDHTLVLTRNDLLVLKSISLATN
mmetsp:Transcript_2970/g.6802  ORF Transcript_2970/g.6802 Transcript_2970/m.6802 type:complete len:366 (+) Transcript_2970:120-1217(+)